MQSSNQWFRHALRRTGWQPQRQAVAVGVLGVFLALMMGALYLSQVAMEASRGREMRELVSYRDDIERTNEELRVEIAELKSLSRLQARAVELGFTPATRAEQVYLVVDGYVPNRALNVTQSNLEQMPAPIYDETFGGWLEQQLDNLRQQFDTFNQQD